jgi:hypothetical protein
VQTPPAEHGIIAVNAEAVQLNINLEGEGENRVPVYSLSVGNKGPAEDDANLHTTGELLDRLRAYLDRTTGRFEVTINAHPDVRSGLVRELTAALETEPFRGRIIQKFLGVSEK